MRTIPTDSTDAREQRQAEQSLAEAEALEQRTHAETCRAGWLGEDEQGRPIPCPRCRPHTLNRACPTCAASHSACQAQRHRRRGACCDHCCHAVRGPGL